MILHIKSYLRELIDQIDALDESTVNRVADVLWSCYSERRRLVVCGNGGSASTASHFATDLQKGLMLASDSRTPWEVLSICDSMPLITAWSNDTDYANVFAAQVRCWLRPGDVLVAISGSGNSKNILQAVDAARQMGAITIGFCGYGGGALAHATDISIALPSKNMQHIEDIHLIISHVIFSAMRERIELSSRQSIAAVIEVKPVESVR